VGWGRGGGGGGFFCDGVRRGGSAELISVITKLFQNEPQQCLSEYVFLFRGY